MQLLIGWATTDITPGRPVELIGQYYQRISQNVRDPLTATALALEQGTGESRQQAVLVSLDTIFVTRDFQEEVRQKLRERIADLDPTRVALNATHIHSGASWFAPFRWWTPAAGAMAPPEVRALMRDRVVSAVEEAWRGRRPGGISFASALAPTGYCRRTRHSDGRAEMYGDPTRTDFVGLEADHDDEVRMLFTWDPNNKLTGVVVNVACPAQVMEARYVVSADFFGELRRRLRASHGFDIPVLAQVAAAGDQSPRCLPRQRFDEVNYWDEGGVVAIGARLAEAVGHGLARGSGTIHRAPVLRHEVCDLALPIRRATRAEYQAAIAESGRLSRGFADVAAASRELYARFVSDTLAREKRETRGPFDDKDLDFVQLENAQAVIARYESQEQVREFPVELHALRVGDCAFVLNPFELYLDFGQMIQARSRAKMTFVVELAGDAGGYLSTARAEAAGGYGSLIINGRVGAEGGRLLVEASVGAIARLWEKGILHE